MINPTDQDLTENASDKHLKKESDDRRPAR